LLGAAGLSLSNCPNGKNVISSYYFPFRMSGLQKTVYEILEGEEKRNVIRRIFNIFIVIAILLNIVVIILDSVKSYHDQWGQAFMITNVACVAVFSVEYVFRIWSCTVNPKYKHPLYGRLGYGVTPLPLIDLIAILPFYLPFIGIDLSYLRILRIFRILRIAKLGRYSESLKIMGAVLKERKEQLIAVVLILVMFVIVASAIMYDVEGDNGTEGFENIPKCMWWSIVTLTTVGYGDVVPTTPLGKFFGGLISISGIVFYALPTAIIGAGFIQELQKRKKLKKKEDIICPHCGKKIIR
jgi:voltage-gated potassium channel